MKRLLVASCLAAAGFHAAADAVDAERERIGRERAAAEARFAAQEAECRGRFAVNDCLDQARRIRGEALADLRRQEVTLNDAERRRRSAEQMRKVEQAGSAAQQTDEAQRRARAVAERQARADRAAEKARERAARAAAAAQRAGDRPAPQTSPGQAAAERAAFERKQAEARERREAAARKRAERSKPAASGLPVPP